MRQKDTKKAKKNSKSKKQRQDKSHIVPAKSRSKENEKTHQPDAG